jgi:hypothetical protein
MLNSLSPQEINIEEPHALIVHMALPTTYPNKTIALCGLAKQKSPELTLPGKAKFFIPKGLGRIEDLKIRDTSKEIV